MVKRVKYRLVYVLSVELLNTGVDQLHARLWSCHLLFISLYIIYTQIISTTLRGYYLLRKYYVIVVSRGVLQSQTIPTGIDLFNNNILQRLRDQFTQQWNSDIDNSPKSINFRMFKLNFEKENYLIVLPPALWIPLCKFRCRNHKLPVEKFRQNSEDMNLGYCSLCHINEVGDEFHYVLKRIYSHIPRLLLSIMLWMLVELNYWNCLSSYKLLLGMLMDKKCCNFIVCLPGKQMMMYISHTYLTYLTCLVQRLRE